MVFAIFWLEFQRFYDRVKLAKDPVSEEIGVMCRIAYFLTQFTRFHFSTGDMHWLQFTVGEWIFQYILQFGRFCEKIVTLIVCKVWRKIEKVKAEERVQFDFFVMILFRFFMLPLVTSKHRNRSTAFFLRLVLVQTHGGGSQIQSVLCARTLIERVIWRYFFPVFPLGIARVSLSLAILH